MSRPEGSSRAPRLLLVVEDEPLVRAFLVEALSRMGHAIVEAPSAEAALAQVEARGQAPDGLITDVRLPGMSGPALVRRLRERTPRLPALYITGHAGDHVLVRGSDDDGPCLPKPFRVAELMKAVDALLEPAP